MNMREKVARDMARADGKDPDANSCEPTEIAPGLFVTTDVYMPWWMKYQRLADAALSALAEPDEGMVRAGGIAFCQGLGAEYSARLLFTAMIRAAKGTTP